MAAIDDVQLGTVLLTATLDKRNNIKTLAGRGSERTVVLHFEKVEASGGDVELYIDDRSTMTVPEPGRPLSTGRLDVSGSFRLLDSFYERLRTKTERDALQQLYLGQPDWKSAKGRDGEYGIRCVGPPAMKSCRPSRPRGGRGRYTPSARKRQATGDGAEDAGDAGLGRGTTGRKRAGRLRSVGDRDDGTRALSPRALDRPRDRGTPRPTRARDRGDAPERPGFIRDRDGLPHRPGIRGGAPRPHVPRAGRATDPEELPEEPELVEGGEELPLEVGPAEEVPYEPPPEGEELVEEPGEVYEGDEEGVPYEEGEEVLDEEIIEE